VGVCFTEVCVSDFPKNSENPYQSPRAYASRDSDAPKTPREIEFENLRRLAICQKGLLFAVAAYLLRFFGPAIADASGYRLSNDAIGVVHWVVVFLGVAAVGLVAIRLNGALAGSMLTALTFVPCADIIIMLAVHQQTNMYFRRSGVFAGPLGPRWRDLTPTREETNSQMAFNVGRED
jgi:hypothetical protein